MKLKKVLSLFVATAILVSNLCISSLVSYAIEAADDGIYYISTAEELVEYATLVNADKTGTGARVSTAMLTDDIDLSGVSWTSIGTSSRNFSGTFDGQGYTISGLTKTSTSTYTGLFGCISGATIKNVNLSNVSITSSSMYAGGIVGSATSSTIDNCHVLSGSVSSTATYSYDGGIAGVASGTTITSCSNAASVSGLYFVGGIVGYAYNSSTISGCYNTGTVTSSNSMYTGGIAGKISSAVATNCYNTGAISGYAYVGGIVGTLESGTISLCYNEGTVTGTMYVAGITGDGDDSTVKNCYNAGEITGTSTGVSGIVGYDWGSNTISNCHNYGTITGTAKKSTLAIVGYYLGSTVSNCYYLDTSCSYNDSNATSKTDDEFASGEVCYLLNDSSSSSVVWYQTLGADSYPVLASSSLIVYYCETCDTYTNGTAQPNNNGTHAVTCDGCGAPMDEEECTYSAYTDNEDGATHTGTCVACGYTTIFVHGDYETVTVEVSCTTDGSTTYTCVCGYSYVDITEESPGHSWGDYVDLGDGNHRRICETCESTATSAHYCVYKYSEGVINYDCIICSYVLPYTVIATLDEDEYTYTGETLDISATVIAIDEDDNELEDLTWEVSSDDYEIGDGTATVTLYVDDSKVGTILLSFVVVEGDHEYGDYEQADNYTHTRTCALCDDVDTEDCTLEWTLANDDSNKVITATCSVCGQVYTLTVEITLESDEYTYTGEEIEPTITSVTIDGEEVAYTIYGYSDNINVTEDDATATIIITLTDYDNVNVEAYFTIVEEEEEEEDSDDEEEEEDTDEEDDDTDEDTTEDTDSEEATEDTSDSTDTSTSTDDTTDSTDTSTTTSTYTSAYIQYIGGILMSGKTSTSIVEDVSTGTGTTAGERAGGSAVAVVSLVGVAMAIMIGRKRK